MYLVVLMKSLHLRVHIGSCESKRCHWIYSRTKWVWSKLKLNTSSLNDVTQLYNATRCVHFVINSEFKVLQLDWGGDSVWEEGLHLAKFLQQHLLEPKGTKL